MSNELEEIEVCFYYDGRPTEVTFWRKRPVCYCYQATPSSLRRCVQKAIAKSEWGVGFTTEDDGFVAHFRVYAGYIG